MTRPADHEERMERARVSLAGLSVGDAFGERFFGPEGKAREMLATRTPPRPRWSWTDDTAMALSIVEVLDRFGEIDQDALAEAFARRHRAEPARGYGAGARLILTEIHEGRPWRESSQEVFGGTGSLGNGGAMRAAPIGAYFFDDPERVVLEARKSAEVTHAHPEGQAGAIAVALAAAFAATAARTVPPPAGALRQQGLFDEVLERMPAGVTTGGIGRAAELANVSDVLRVARELGNGSRVSAPDTVPLCLWAIKRHGGNFEAALWETVSALGDRDTTCAIVGGISVLFDGLKSIPTWWLEAREPLPDGFAPRGA